MQPGRLYVIAAPSGAGKTSLVKALMEREPRMRFSVSYTTRAPRGMEQPDREYHYTTPAKFQEMIDKGEFLEWASVFDNYYGTACQSLIDAEAVGHDLLLDIDVQGAGKVREKMPDAVSIFVLPPNPDILKERLRNRSIAEGKLDEAEIGRRLAKARGEIENYRQYRYILINDILEDAVEALTAIVITERALRHGAPPDPETARMMQLADKCRQGNSSDRLDRVLSSFGLLDMHATRA